MCWLKCLERRVLGEVGPGPPTLLTNIKEHLAVYIEDMIEMGFGFSREDVLCLVFTTRLLRGTTLTQSFSSI